MAEKNEMIKNGNDISIDNGNVTVINSGISLAEKQEEKVPAQVEVEAPVSDIIPEPVAPVAPVSLENSIPEVQEPVILPVEPIAPIIPEVAPTNAFEDVKIPAELPLSFQTPAQNISVGANEPLYPGMGIETTAPATIPVAQEENNSSFFESGVYKSSVDVDLAKEAFLKDVQAAYDKNIVLPTKAVVELLNSFVNWGNEVTRQGLNRPLFEEFDSLKDRYNGLKTASYGDDEPTNNFGGMNF